MSPIDTTTASSPERLIQTTENIAMSTHAVQGVRTAHPPQPPGPPPVAQSLHNRIARTSLPDRVAMWLGLRLLLWGTRPVTGQPTTAELHQWRLEREHLKRQMELDRIRATIGFFGQQLR